jgi:lysophospholipase L1-like esterase
VPSKKRTSVWLLVLTVGFGTQFTAAQSTQAGWMGTWGMAPTAEATSGPTASGNLTFRNIVHISLGGSSMRLQFSNEFGTGPLTVGPVQVALSAGGGAIQPGTGATVTFGTNASVTIPAGSVAFSDPVAFTTRPLSNVEVSFFIPAQTIQTETCHQFALASNYVSTGQNVGKATIGGAIENWCYLKGVDVENGTAGASVVTLGDSITAGYQSPLDANARWTDYLAVALQGNASTPNISVINEGIVDNLLLGAGLGPNGLARIDRDVLAQTGVGYLILAEGINDLGYATQTGSTTTLTAAALIQGYEQVVTRAHTHGIKVFVATITPDGGTSYYPPNDDTGRQAVNAWIRNSGGVLDGYIDFDAALTNGATPVPALLPQYDSGDHLHPNAAGYSVMASQINLSLFQGSPGSSKQIPK